MTFERGTQGDRTQQAMGIVASSGRRILTYPLYNFSLLLAGGASLSAHRFWQQGRREWYRGMTPGVPFGVCKEMAQLGALAYLDPHLPPTKWKPLAQTAVAISLDGLFAGVNAAIHQVRMALHPNVWSAIRENPRILWDIRENKALSVMGKGAVWWLACTGTHYALHQPTDTSLDVAWKGAVAGLVASTAAYPFDTVRIHSLAQTSAGKKAPPLWPIARQTLKEGTLFRGILPCWMSGALSGTLIMCAITGRNPSQSEQ